MAEEAGEKLEDRRKATVEECVCGRTHTPKKCGTVVICINEKCLNS